MQHALVRAFAHIAVRLYFTPLPSCHLQSTLSGLKLASLFCSNLANLVARPTVDFLRSNLLKPLANPAQAERSAAGYADPRLPRHPPR
eukprot:6206005-Pleurochrysis_carterae.AAC.2